MYTTDEAAALVEQEARRLRHAAEDAIRKQAEENVRRRQQEEQRAYANAQAAAPSYEQWALKFGGVLFAGPTVTLCEGLAGYRVSAYLSQPACFDPPADADAGSALCRHVRDDLRRLQPDLLRVESDVRGFRDVPFRHRFHEKRYGPCPAGGLPAGWALMVVVYTRGVAAFRAADAHLVQLPRGGGRTWEGEVADHAYWLSKRRKVFEDACSAAGGPSADDLLREAELAFEVAQLKGQRLPACLA